MLSPDTIYLALARIPRGKVATYGDIAALAGLGRNARYVGRILSQLPKDSTLPWHRVINSQGKISFPINSPGYQEQKKRLLDEGISFNGNRIRLREYRWHVF